jgi:hypothetical protein
MKTFENLPNFFEEQKERKCTFAKERCEKSRGVCVYVCVRVCGKLFFVVWWGGCTHIYTRRLI